MQSVTQNEELQGFQEPNEPGNSAQFGVKHSKLRKNKLILDINFFFEKAIDNHKWLDITDTIISNGFLESQERNFE